MGFLFFIFLWALWIMLDFIFIVFLAWQCSSNQQSIFKNVNFIAFVSNYKMSEVFVSWVCMGLRNYKMSIDHFPMSPSLLQAIPVEITCESLSLEIYKFFFLHNFLCISLDWKHKIADYIATLVCDLIRCIWNLKSQSRIHITCQTLERRFKNFSSLTNFGFLLVNNNEMKMLAKDIIWMLIQI